MAQKYISFNIIFMDEIIEEKNKMLGYVHNKDDDIIDTENVENIISSILSGNTELCRKLLDFGSKKYGEIVLNFNLLSYLVDVISNTSSDYDESQLKNIYLTLIAFHNENQSYILNSVFFDSLLIHMVNSKELSNLCVIVICNILSNSAEYLHLFLHHPVSNAIVHILYEPNPTVLYPLSELFYNTIDNENIDNITFFLNIFDCSINLMKQVGFNHDNTIYENIFLGLSKLKDYSKMKSIFEEHILKNNMIEIVMSYINDDKSDKRFIYILIEFFHDNPEAINKFFELKIYINMIDILNNELDTRLLIFAINTLSSFLVLTLDFLEYLLDVNIMEIFNKFLCSGESTLKESVLEFICEIFRSTRNKDIWRVLVEKYDFVSLLVEHIESSNIQNIIISTFHHIINFTEQVNFSLSQIPTLIAKLEEILENLDTQAYNDAVDLLNILKHQQK